MSYLSAPCPRVSHLLPFPRPPLPAARQFLRNLDPEGRCHPPIRVRPFQLLPASAAGEGISISVLLVVSWQPLHLHPLQAVGGGSIVFVALRGGRWLVHHPAINDMAPGKKPPVRPRQPAEAPLTDYERLRAQNMMKNNQMFQRLGLSALSSFINNRSAISNGDAPQASGSLYDEQDSDGASEQEEVSQVSQLSKGASNTISSRGANITARGNRKSKRVAAPELEEPTRVTRQRSATTKQVPSQGFNAATNDDLEPPSSPAQHDADQIDVADEGALTATTQQAPRGQTRGKQLDSLTRGLGTKIPIQISEGKRRPEPPMQAAKLASEGGIILRQHIPIYPHWKNYKKDEAQITNYIGKLAGQFTMDIDSKPVKDACLDLLKCGQRQRRHMLKKKYFDGVPANQVRTTSPIKHMTDDQWRELVEMWSSTKHKNKCITNQLNRGKVVFQQRTGSQCYIAKTYLVKQDKYKDTEPSAIDLFKDTHCSSKKGFTEPVKKAIDDMEMILAQPEDDGQHHKSSITAVSEVLPQSSKFLQNVGILSSSKSSTRVGMSSKVQELEAQLESEKQEKAELRQEMDTLKLQAQESDSSMAKQSHEIESLKETMKSQAQQSEAAMAKQSQEIETLKKTVQDCTGFLRQLVSFQGFQGPASAP